LPASHRTSIGPNNRGAQKIKTSATTVASGQKQANAAASLLFSGPSFTNSGELISNASLIIFPHSNRRVGCCRFGRIRLPHPAPLCDKVDQTEVKAG
jgi:hypothetical protein